MRILGIGRLLAVILALLLLAPIASLGPASAEDTPSAISSQDSLPAARGTIPQGGWIAYRLAHRGGVERVDVVLTYEPSDDPNDRYLTNGGQVTMAVYSPSAPPPYGTPIAWAAGNGGQKEFRLDSAVAGDYVFIVNNWDGLGRRVTFGLSAVRASDDSAASITPNVEALILISASEGASETQPAEADQEEGYAGDTVAPETPQGQSPAEQSPQAGDSPNVKRVGLQAGHWRSAELPDELARLRTSTGTSGGGVPEWQLNLDVARRVAVLLEAEGVAVDIIPATVPVGYTADAFIALHADGDLTGRFSGYKLAHGRWSGDPVTDQALLDAITLEYGAATGMAWDAHVSRNMTGYYAFSNRRFQHAIAAGTPAVILEMGFMTNRSDLRLLLGDPDTVARGIASGIVRFLAHAS